jgi:hypothetical protein
VALWHNILRVLRRCRERPWNDEVGANVSHDTVDRRVNAEGLANYGIEERKGFKFLVGWQAKGAVRAREMLDLFLIDRLTKSSVISVRTRNSGR